MYDALHQYLEKDKRDIQHKEYFWYIILQLQIAELIEKKKEFYVIGYKTTTINKYKNILISAGIIISDGSYIPGKKVMKFKLNPAFLSGEIIKVEINPTHIIGKHILKKHKNNKAHYNRFPSYMKQMLDHFRAVEILYEEAEEYILKHVPKEKQCYYLTAIDHLKDKRFRHFGRNTTNKRLDSNLTNFPSVLKKFIQGDFIQIDLKNSQPFFLSQIINKILQAKEGKGSTLCYLLSIDNLYKTFGPSNIIRILKTHQNSKKEGLVNFTNYKNTVCTGEIYDNFIEVFPNSISRKEVKTIFFRVFFSQNNHYKSEKEKLSKVYPFIEKAIQFLKKKEYKRLAIFLQKLESYIFIDCIAKELVEVGIVPLTIHDSVIVLTDQKDQALKIVKEVFQNNFGVVPAFHVEPLKDS